MWSNVPKSKDDSGEESAKAQKWQRGSEQRESSDVDQRILERHPDVLSLKLVLTLEQRITLLLLPHRLCLLSIQEPSLLSANRDCEEEDASNEERNSTLDDEQPSPWSEVQTGTHGLDTIGNQSSKGTRNSRSTVDDGHALGLLSTVPDCGDDEDHAGEKAGFERAENETASHCLAVCVAETRSESCGAPAEHGDAEDAVGAESLDGDDPEDVADDVSDLYQY